MVKGVQLVLREARLVNQFKKTTLQDSSGMINVIAK